MTKFRSMELPKVPRHVKTIRVNNQNANAFSQRSPISEAQANLAESVLTPSNLSKTKVFPLDHVQPKQSFPASSISRNNEASLQNSSQNPAPLKCSKMLAIGLGALVSICALAALAIGLYFLISKNTNTTSTTTSTTSTTTTCTLGLCWNSSGITVLGTGSSGSNSDRLSNPYHLVIDSAGSFYVADCGNNRIQKFTASSSVATTVAGQANGQGGSASNQLNQPACVLLDSSDNLYVLDTNNHRVQYFANGSMTGITVAGIGGQGSNSSQFYYPHGLARDSSTGKLYISDTYNNRIMSYSPGATAGIVVAGGNGQGSYNNQLNIPFGIYLNVSSNSLYIANNNGHNIVSWVVNASSWTLIAGNGNEQSGPTSTMLNYPTDVTLDYMGNVYVTDNGNDRIQFFLSGEFTGTTIAGILGVYASAANTLDAPQSVTLDSDLNLYVVDSGNNRIQKFQRY